LELGCSGGMDNYSALYGRSSGAELSCFNLINEGIFFVVNSR